jgi:hypothetical protein
MPAFGHLIIPTPQVTTGDPTTVNDAAAQIPVGSIWFTKDNSGNSVAYQYVQFNPTAPGAFANGTPVYYKDGSRTVVTDTPSEAATYAAASDSAIGSFAGVLLNGSVTAGNFCVIQKAGVFSFGAGAMSAAVVKGDRGVLSNAANAAPTADKWTRVAAGTAFGTSDAAQAVCYCLSASTAFLYTPFLL